MQGTKALSTVQTLKNEQIGGFLLLFLLLFFLVVSNPYSSCTTLEKEVAGIYHSHASAWLVYSLRLQYSTTGVHMHTLCVFLCAGEQ